MIDVLRKFLSKFSKSQLLRNMGVSSISAVMTSAISIISYPLYLHYLGYRLYGLWLLLSVVISIAQLGSFGIPWALMKLVAEDHSHEDWEGVKTYIISGCALILASGLILLTAVLIFRRAILFWLKLTGADALSVFAMLPYVAALSVIVILFSAVNASLGGMGRMDLTSSNEVLAQLLGLISTAILLIFGYRLPAMVFGTLIGYVLAQLVALIEIQRIVPVSLISTTRFRSQKIRQLLGTGGWVLSSSLFAGLALPFTRVILSRFAGLEAVTINDICWTGSMRIRSVFDSAFRPLIPEVSNLYASLNELSRQRMKSIDRKIFKSNFAVALPVFLAIILAIKPALHLWLHHSYNPLLPGVFRITLVGAFCSLLGSSSYYIFVGIGKARESAYSAAIQTGSLAAILIVIALCLGRVTVGEAACAFAAANLMATLYLRYRMRCALRQIDRDSDIQDLKLPQLEVRQNVDV